MYNPGDYAKLDYSSQRRPHQASGGRNENLGQSAATALSPNAKEFVPQHLQQHCNDNSTVNGLTNEFGKMSTSTNQTLTQVVQLNQQQLHSHMQQQQQQQQQQQIHYHNQGQQISSMTHYQPQNTQFKRNASGASERLNKPQQFNNHHHHPHHHQNHQQQFNNLQHQQQHHQQQNSNSATMASGGVNKPSTLQNRLYRNKAHQPPHLQEHSLTSSSSSPSSVNNTQSFFSASAIQNYETSHEENSTSQENHTEEEIFALNYIADIVECLNNDPGSYDSIATRALNVFRSFAENQYVLSNVMEIIFSQSIEEQNFRYMGAKLYALLDSLNPKSDSLFRTLLSCKLNYDREEIKAYMQSESSKVRGTTLFLAELYMQLRNNGSTVPELAQHIIFTMNQLLQKRTPENLKCICLTLKLAGYNLESNCPNELMQIIHILRGIELDVSTNRIIENTLNLHSNNWGRCETVTSQPTYTNNQPIRWSNEPVFYGPDGQVLSEEENSFLDDVSSSDVINEDEPDFDDFDAEGMTAEMEQDYNEFLKNTINLNH